MLIKCKECGNEISDKSNKCPHCGCQNNRYKGIETITESVVETEQVESKKKNRTVKKKTRIMNKKVIIIVTAIIVIIVLFGILVGTHTICLKHEYSEATVLEPQTCWHCGKALGKPNELQAIKFPTKGVGSLIPIPKSNMGEIEFDGSDYFSAYIGNTNKSDYSAYVDDCLECGFDVDYARKSESYYGDDKYGNTLFVYYKKNNIMYIKIYASDDETNLSQTLNCDTDGHKENDWVTVKEATESEVGEKQKVCTVCGEILKSEKVYYYEITEDEAVFYTNVLDIYNSIAKIHISPETFKLLGAVATDSRVTIYLEYAGMDGSTYTDYFWKDIDDDTITNKYGEENYTGFAQSVNTLDVAEILYYEKSGDYVSTISDDVVVDY